MKKHTTKRALLMSALSLLVCVSMLVGSTFAWFTDSVSSDRNIIQAGNLDVTLEYWDGDSYEEVTSSTKLFNDAALWEPGHAEVAYLKIENAGSLALKYQLAVNVYNETTATNVAGETFKLSDHLVFSVVEKKLTSRDDMYTREEAVAAAGNAMGLTSYNSGTVEMLPTDEADCVALIIYMPTSVGNEANYRGAAPTIELGTTLVATQMASEQDSWNNSFDLKAPYPVISLPAPMPETGVAAEDIVLNTEKGTETGIPAELVADIADQYPEAEELRLTHTEPVIDTAAKTVTFTHFDIVDEKGNVIDLEAMNNTTPVTVVISVGDAFAEGDVVVIYHDKEAVASAVVSADKTVTYTTTHFCEVVVSTGDGTIDSAAELAAAVAAGGTIKLEQDVVLTQQILIPEGVSVTLDLNGKSISSTGIAIRNEGNLRIVGKGKISSVSSYAIRVQKGSLVIDTNDLSVVSDFGAISVFNGANVTINGGHYENKGYLAQTSHTIYLGGYGTININGGTFDSGYSNGGIDTICGYGWSNAAGEKAIININGGTFYPSELNGSYYFISNYDSSWTEININGGTFHKYDPSKIGGTKLAEGYLAKDNGDGTFTVAPPSVSTADELKNVIVNEGGLIAIDGKIAVDNIGAFDFSIFDYPGVEKATTIVGGILSRDSGNGTGLNVRTSEPVVFEGVTFQSAKGSAVLENRTAGANITLNNCLLENLGAPSTGNTGIKIVAENTTYTFNNCTFKNMPIDVTSSAAKGTKLVFNNCTFNWEGDNCPGMIKLANSVEADIDLNDCKFAYTTNSQYNSSKNFINYNSGVGTTTIDFNNFQVVGTRNNDRIWTLCGSSANATITTTGTLVYTFNGQAVDFNTYLKY